MTTATKPRALTPKQRDILEYLWDGLLNDGFQPSMRDVMHRFAFGSPNAVRVHLQAMARKGWIEPSSGESRAVRFLFTPEGEPFCGLEPRKDNQ